MRLELTMPLPDNKANKRQHWRTALKVKKELWATLDTLKAVGVLPRPPGAPLAPCLIHVHAYVWAYRDDDNMMASMKPVLDWLEGNGYIATDSRRDLKWAGIPEQSIDRKNQRVEITLEAVK